MGIILTILAIAVVTFGGLYWFIQLYSTILVVKNIRSVASLKSPVKRSWPRVSVIMPARNEAATIEQALHIRCESDYPDLELIVINDRSTDDTGVIAERIAKTDDRVRVIHIETLPEGWIGKLYAMHVGAQQAQGEWLLFSDVDVHVKSGTLRRVIAWCEEKAIDHMAIIPDLYPTSFLLDVTLSVFMRHICVLGRPWNAGNPESKDAVGAGAFNLVRRKAFDHAHGFETMKLTVTDDVVFGRILKQTGARAGVLNGRDHVNVYFYRTLHDMACGSERALFTMFANFSAARLILIGTLMLFLELAPFIALLFFALPVLQMIGAGLTLTALVVSLVVNIYLGRPWWTSFFVPVAIMIMYICMVRAAILGKKRGGIYWRGTFYSSEQLRKGRQI